MTYHSAGRGLPPSDALALHPFDGASESSGSDTLRRRHVMHITWSLVVGGSENYAFTIAARLDRRRYQSTMCAMDRGGPLEPEIRRLGMPALVMHRRQGIDWRLIWRMYRLFRRHKVDVVHTHHFNQLFYSILGARLAGARVIHTEHSVEMFKKRRLRIALRLLSLLCHKVVAIGEDGEQTLRQRVGIPARKLEVIRAGVDLARFNDRPEHARRSLDLDPSHRVAAIVARLSPEKNHALLLSAFAEVVQRVPEARLLIVGDGAEREAIARQIDRLNLSQQVRMLGVRRDIPRILAASDIFVLCSTREGLPIAVLEAMAASRPVVATAVGDLPIIVHDDRNGILVPSGDRASLGKAIADLMLDPRRASAMGRHGRTLVESGYAVDGMIARHEALYAS